METDGELLVCGCCGYAYRVAAGHCDNPVCEGNPTVPRDFIARLKAEAAARHIKEERREEAMMLWGSSFSKRR